MGFLSLLILGSLLFLPSLAHAKGKYWLKLSYKVVQPYTVVGEVKTNIPDPILVAVDLDLKGLRGSDISIGTDMQKVKVVNGVGKFTINGETEATPIGSILPRGKYWLQAAFHSNPNWKENHPVGTRLGIKGTLETKVGLKLKASGKSVASVKKKLKGRYWVMSNVSTGMKWKPGLWRRKFGAWKSLPLANGNPRILKMYYFKSIDMTLMVNVLKGRVITFRDGMAYR